jgi:AcrR family transcriptional regulator
MSPRPRTVSDAQILQAALRTMARLGPVRLTLAAVAKDAGLSAATLVQRFGSKRALLLAVSASAAGSMAAAFAQLRAAAPSPLAALLEAATAMARQTRTPDELANSLAFLQIDVSDPEFRRPMREMSRQTLAGYRRLLEDAVRAGELRPCDTPRVARAVAALAGGSLISWAVFRQGSADAWVRADLDTLIEPYRAGSPRPAARRRRADTPPARRPRRPRA